MDVIIVFIKAPTSDLEWAEPLTSFRVFSLQPQSCRGFVSAVSARPVYGSDGRAHGELSGSSGSGSSFAVCRPWPRHPRNDC